MVEVNGMELEELNAYRMGDYLITAMKGSPNGQHTVAHLQYVHNSWPVRFEMTYVGDWYGLPDAIQGAKFDVMKRRETETDVPCAPTAV